MTAFPRGELFQWPVDHNAMASSRNGSFGTRHSKACRDYDGLVAKLLMLADCAVRSGCSVYSVRGR